MKTKFKFSNKMTSEDFEMRERERERLRVVKGGSVLETNKLELNKER